MTSHPQVRGDILKSACKNGKEKIDPRGFPSIESTGNCDWLDTVLSPGVESILLINQSVEIKVQPHC